MEMSGRISGYRIQYAYV